MVINIKAALDECYDHITDIRRRNETLVYFYIYPNPVPTAIAAYDGPLSTLQARIKSIKKLNFSQLEQLIDDPDCLAARHLSFVIPDLLNAIIGFKSLFEAHYDRTLAQRAPYASTLAALDLLHRRLQDLIRIRESNPDRPCAEHLVITSTAYHFCRSAIQVLNDKDQGLIANTADKPPLVEQNGAFLFWKCPLPTCTFKLRFHILGSHASSIHNNAEIRSHLSIPLEYRSAFLIKSHLHSTSTSFSALQSSYEIEGAMKYGCLFCFAEGKPLQAYGSAFASGRELALHMVAIHKEAKLPAAMVLEKLKVAVGGKCPVGVRRWDMNFLGG